MRLLFLHLCCLLCVLGVHAQEADTAATDDPPPFDASGYGDADVGGTKRYASQKVIGQSPTKLVYAGFDFQGPTELQLREVLGQEITNAPVTRFASVPGIRFAYNTPVISRSTGILNLAVQYAGTRFRGGSAVEPLGASVSQNWFHSIGLQATVFKPLNERFFILAQASADHNSDGFFFDENALTYSGTALFGWKPHDRLMAGIGAARTYRLGAVIHVPVLYYYHTYNSHWGAEVVLPARAHIRYNLSKRSLLLGGYELEGQQYLMSENTRRFIPPFLRRGEVRPRIMYERALAGFFWLSVQAGARINGRFNFANQYGDDGDEYAIGTDLSTAPYGQIGIALVSP